MTVIKKYDFNELAPGNGEFHQGVVSGNFSMNDFSNEGDSDIADDLKKERALSEMFDFKIDKNVQDHRGHVENKIAEQRLKISEIVNRELSIIKKKSVEEGIQQGINEGNLKVLEKEDAALRERLQNFDGFIEKLEGMSEKLMETKKNELLMVVKSITKWICKKEKLTNEEYIESILNNVIKEFSSSQRIIVKMSPEFSDHYYKSIESFKDKSKFSQTIEFVHDVGLKDMDIEVELENNYLKFDQKSQEEVVDKIFNDLKGTDGN